jgi:hypothetical protein
MFCPSPRGHELPGVPTIFSIWILSPCRASGPRHDGTPGGRLEADQRFDLLFDRTLTRSRQLSSPSSTPYFLAAALIRPQASSRS